MQLYEGKTFQAGNVFSLRRLFYIPVMLNSELTRLV